MARQAHDLTVLDHHKTAAADLAGLDYAVFDMERSGAGITWDYFHPKQARPIFVTHIEDRDLWKFDNSLTKFVCAAYQRDMEKLATSDAKVEATRLLLHLGDTDEGYLRMVEEGRLLDEQFRGLVANICATPYRVELLGVPCVAVRTRRACSRARQATIWSRRGTCLQRSGTATAGELKVSLRSRDDLADVSDIARAFGGGGHRNAAGFRTALGFFQEIGGALRGPR